MSKGVLLTVIAAIGWVAAAPAFARPPTTTISPGYDRRLQESRRVPPAVVVPPSPSPGPRLPHRSLKPNG